MKIEDNKYKRIPDTQNFGLYVGHDNLGRTSLFVKVSKKPTFITNSKYLIFDYNRRNDSLWALTISIANQQYIKVFQKFVDDLVESVSGISNSKVAERKFIQRFREWQTLFEKEVSSIMDFHAIVGLIGELHFLKEFMIKKYGVQESIEAWVGPNGADKDFVINNTWYEIKTKSLNKETIHLNNQNQLFSDKVGYLTIISYEKTSLLNEGSINLLDLYYEISNLIGKQSLQTIFDNKLASVNFIPVDKYRETNVLLHKTDFYKVDQEFPQIQNIEFHNVITNIEYDLFLPELKSYKVEV